MLFKVLEISWFALSSLIIPLAPNSFTFLICVENSSFTKSSYVKFYLLKWPHVCNQARLCWVLADAHQSVNTPRAASAHRASQHRLQGWTALQSRCLSCWPYHGGVALVLSVCPYAVPLYWLPPPSLVSLSFLPDSKGPAILFVTVQLHPFHFPWEINHIFS